VKPIPVLLTAALLLPALGCITERQIPKRWERERVTLFAEEQAYPFKPILSRYSIDPALGDDLPGSDRVDPADLFGPYHLYARNTYLHSDGSVTLHYYLEPTVADKVARLLVGHVKGLTKLGDNTPPSAPNQVVVFPGFVKDKRLSSGTGMPGFMAQGHSTDVAADLMLLRANNDTLAAAERFIKKFLVEVPLIEVKVCILDVALDDNLQYGITSNVTRLGGGDPLISGWTTHFNTNEMLASDGFTPDDLATWFDPARADVDPGFQGSFFIVEGVHDKLRLQAAMELLQRSSNSEILSAPRVRVLNGHKALIETGSDIPIQEVTVSGSSTTFKYKYEPVGVNMAIVPLQLMDGSIQIQVTTNVSAVTGEKVFTVGGGSTINIPVIANRGASTMVNVKSGQAFLLAGLITTADIEVVSKIPLLGDIPVLGLLFKSKDRQEQKTQLVFYIEPRIVESTEVLYEG